MAKFVVDKIQLYVQKQMTKNKPYVIGMEYVEPEEDENDVVSGCTLEQIETLANGLLAFVQTQK